MWHHVALNSCNPQEQLKAYQNAIDVLQVILISAVSLRRCIDNDLCHDHYIYVG